MYDMIFFLKLFGILIFSGILFACMWGFMNWYKTVMFRKIARESHSCKFYVGEIREIGKIIDRTGDLFKVEYFDSESGRPASRSVHKSQIYAAW